MATSTNLAPATFGRERARFIVSALGVSLLLFISAKTSVPFWPVPMTMQPLAVLAVAALAGRRIAIAGLVAYLIEGACGLPVFTGTPARGIGLAYMVGPTMGYILGWFPAMLVADWAARTLARRPLALFAAMVAAMVAIYVPGVAWLGQFTGWNHVLALGVWPFAPADVVKAGLVAAMVLATARLRRA